LQFLYFANGGLIGYFDDGTIVGCPRCDLMDKNIEAIKTREPHLKFKMENGFLISEQGDSISINSMRNNKWAIVNYENITKNVNKQIIIKLQYGIGIITPEIDSLKYSQNFCCVVLPEQGFTAYNKPNGKIIGKIKRINEEQNNQSAYESYFISKNAKIKLNDYSEIGYEIFALNFTEIDNGFVKIKNQHTDIWFSISELKELGFKTINWIDYMALNSKDVLGYYAKEPGLRIRSEPNTSSKIIGSVRGDLFEIKRIGKISGKWAKVKVRKYKEHPCGTELNEKENIEYRTEGWMKIIDDNGEPNVYNYVRGC